MNEWRNADHARAYLERRHRTSQREVGEDTLLEELPDRVGRVLDLGSGDGHLLGLVLERHPDAAAVALDFSPPMLERLHDRFDSDPRVEIVDHDLELPLPAMGRFDAVVSSFAIHHLPHARKMSLYSEVWRILGTDGVFSNLEHVASPSEALHVKFLEAIGYTIEDEDPSNRLLDVETQLVWLRAIGFHEVDCYWKWRELALLAGRTNDQSPESVL